ncbi:hypothetical protein BWI17_17050 [Betaproteobacteria bacterium GR16-43]|nr:hypothetical protein BWI17_17050 [Betaproteobacteria bacterium GR16-43]
MKISQIALFLLAAPAFAAGITTLPDHPVAGEPFVITYAGKIPATEYAPLSYSVFGSTYAQLGSKVAFVTDFTNPLQRSTKTVTGTTTIADPYNYGTHFVATLGAGSYGVTRDYAGLRAGSYTPGPETLPDTIVVGPPRAAATPASTALSGNYYADDEAGSGVNLIQSPNGQVFAAWFLYAARSYSTPASAPIWYVAPGGKWITPTRFTAILYETQRTAFNRPVDATVALTLPVGTLTLDVVGSTAIDMDATLVTGTRKQKRLNRLQF